MWKKLAAFLVGCVVLLVCLEVGARLAYWGYVFARDRRNREYLTNNPTEIRVLTLGESTTAVAGDETGKFLLMRTSYPSQLEGLLNSKNVQRRFRVINAGVMAGNTSRIIEALKTNLEKYHPQIVVAMMGLKDTPYTKKYPVISDLKIVQLAHWISETVALKWDYSSDSDNDPDDGLGQLRWTTRYIRETRMPSVVKAHSAVMNLLSRALWLWNFGHHRAGDLLIRQINRQYGVGYYFLTRMLASDGLFDDAFRTIHEAEKRFPMEGMYPIGEAELLADTKRYDDALKKLKDLDEKIKKQSVLNPHVVRDFSLLTRAEIYRRQKKYGEAEASLKRVDETVDMADLQDYFPPLDLLKLGTLGEIDYDKNDNVAAEKVLSRLVAKYPQYPEYVWRLATVYRKLGLPDKEESMRRRFLGERGSRIRLADYYEFYKMLKLIGRQSEIPALFAEASRKFPSLKTNFAALYQMTEEHGAKLFLMQYPAFSLGFMKMYAPNAEDITYIDNEHLFDADPNRYFFEPRYPYSYSHFTKAGAHLVAEQVAKAVENYLANLKTESKAAANVSN